MFIRAKLPICAAFCSGTGLKSRNSQTCPTRLIISKLGNQVQIFDTFDRSFSTAGKLFGLGQLLKVVHEGKEFSNIHSNQDFSKTGDHS